jgi:hypothetical protein
MTSRETTQPTAWSKSASEGDNGALKERKYKPEKEKKEK